MSKKDKKISVPIGIGYGLTDFLGGGAFTIIGAFLLFFYTTFAGLTPIQAASIIAAARFVDAAVSLFIGSLTDNFYKTRLGRKFGRRRFFLLIGSPLMAIYVLLWVTGMNYWFYLITYLLFEIIAAMVLIPWEILPDEMIKDFNERTVIFTSRMFIWILWYLCRWTWIKHSIIILSCWHLSSRKKFIRIYSVECIAIYS